MLRKSLEYGAALIATYLVVVHASGAGLVMQKGASGVSGIAKTLQGR